jgi:hypothetical protein
MMSPHKQTLMEKLRVLGLDENHTSGPPLPLVTLEEFFEGNSDLDSIAVNLWPNHPGIDYLYRTLQEIRARPDVQDVLIEIYDLETALAVEESWPFAERVFFVTSAWRWTVEKWSTLLKADGASKGYPRGQRPVNPPRPERGYAVWHIGWD